MLRRAPSHTCRTHRLFLASFSGFTGNAGLEFLEVSKDREAAWPLSVLSQVFWFLVWGNCSSLKFSAILTAASCVQCLGFLLLVLKARGKGQADTLALTPAGGAATRASCSSGASSGATARA